MSFDAAIGCNRVQGPDGSQHSQIRFGQLRRSHGQIGNGGKASRIAVGDHRFGHRLPEPANVAQTQAQHNVFAFVFESAIPVRADSPQSALRV